MNATTSRTRRATRRTLRARLRTRAAQHRLVASVRRRPRSLTTVCLAAGVDREAASGTANPLPRLLRGAFSGNPRLYGMCQELCDHRSWLWQFVEVEGVEPTNNASERALRPAVIWRKLSFGTQSASGSRFVETMLTIVETCRQQSTNVFAFVTAAVEDHFAARTSVSLLPGA